MKITHDFHIHTRLSLCAGPDGGTLGEYLKQFKEQGIVSVGFTDHFWDSNVGFEGLYADSRNAGVPHYYMTQNYEHISALKEELDHTDTGEVEVFFGAEVEYDPARRDIALSPEIAEKLDFVVVPNSHTHMMMPKSYYEPYEKHRDFMVQAFIDTVSSPLSGKILAMAHPFYAVCCPYDVELLMRTVPDDTYRRIFTMAAEKGIAIEINTACVGALCSKGLEKPAVEHIRMFALAKKCGAKFTFGSDAHSIAGHRDYNMWCDKAVGLFSIEETDIAKLPQKAEQ